jgi:hypothetical protein
MAPLVTLHGAPPSPIRRSLVFPTGSETFEAGLHFTGVALPNRNRYSGLQWRLAIGAMTLGITYPHIKKAKGQPARLHRNL